MADLQDSWKEVASRAEALGLKLKLHLEQEESETEQAGATTEGPEGAEPVGAEPEGDQSSARTAIEDLGSRLQDAFDSLSAATKDDAVRADVKEIGSLLKNALADTFSTVSTEVGDVMRKTTGRGDDEADGDDDVADTPGPGPTA